MKFYAKIYRVQNEIMLAACDENVYGLTFEDDKMRLKVSKAFYGEELVDGSDITALLNNATIANLVGEDIVEHAIEIGLVDPNNVIEVEGVPHAQMARM